MEGKRGWGNSGKQFGKYYLIVLTPNLPQQYIDYRHFPVLQCTWKNGLTVIGPYRIWVSLKTFDINKDDCDGRTCMFIVCLTSTHLNLETLFKRRILVLRTATSWCGIAVFSLYHMRYCGIRTPPYAPSFYEKIFWIKVWRNFFHTLLIVTLVTEGLLSPFLCRPIAY